VPHAAATEASFAGLPAVSWGPVHIHRLIHAGDVQEAVAVGDGDDAVDVGDVTRGLENAGVGETVGRRRRASGRGTAGSSGFPMSPARPGRLSRCGHPLCCSVGVTA
jgi:hypothetical protein